MMLVTKNTTLKVAYIERVINMPLLSGAWEHADLGSDWMLQRVLELPGAADENTLFGSGIPIDERADARATSVCPNRTLHQGSAGLALSIFKAKTPELK